MTEKNSPPEPYLLIVENDPLLNLVMLYQLKKIGWSVQSAKNGRQALDLISQRIPGVLILEVALPDISGHAIIEELRGNPTTSAIPVVIHTALDLSREQETKLKLGPIRFLTKGTASNEKLEELVRELMPLNKNQLSNG
jgi:CheY-like chemotaxis protein